MKAGQQIRSRWKLALVSLATTLLISACVPVRFTSEFQRTGAAVHTLSVTFPRDAYESADAAGETTAWNEISSNAADAGMRASKTVDTDTVTLNVSIERPDGEDAGAALNSLLNVTGINPSPGISAPFSGYFRQEGAAIGGSNFVLDMTINGEQLYDAAAASEPAKGLSREIVEEEVPMIYEVTVPGTLLDSTGEETLRGTVRWDIEPDETVFTRTETSAGDTGRAALFIAAAIASATAVAVLAAIVGWVLVKRPRLATSIASSARHFPRRTTITSEGVWVTRHINQIVERFWNRVSPHNDTPVQHDLLDSESEPERSDDGADAERDRPPAGIRGG